MRLLYFIFRKTAKKSVGFTLLEIIITITIAALLGTALITYMSTSITRSVEPVLMLSDHEAAVRTMENITEDYRDWIRNSLGTLNNFETYINANYPAPGTTTRQYTYDAAPDTVSVLEVTTTEGDMIVRALFTL